MGYREKVQDKIQGSRSRERKDLWKEISAAYEQGGVEQVESKLAEKMEGLKDEFEEAIEKLQKIL